MAYIGLKPKSSDSMNTTFHSYVVHFTLYRGIHTQLRSMLCSSIYNHTINHPETIHTIKHTITYNSMHLAPNHNHHDHAILDHCDIINSGLFHALIPSYIKANIYRFIYSTWLNKYYQTTYSLVIHTHTHTHIYI